MRQKENDTKWKCGLYQKKKKKDEHQRINMYINIKDIFLILKFLKYNSLSK